MTDKKKPFFEEFRCIFNRAQQLKFLGLTAMTIFGSMLDTAAVALMLPFMYAVMGTASLNDSRALRLLAGILHCDSQRELIVSIALVMAAAYVVKGIYNYCNVLIQNRFWSACRTTLSGQLLDRILHRPYAYHLRRTTAETLRAVTNDVERLFELVRALFGILAEGATGILLFAVLLVIDVRLTLAAVILIAGTLALTNALIVRKVESAGDENSRRSTEMFRWVQQAMGGLKGVLASRRTQLFINRYAENAKAFAEANSRYITLTTLPRTFVETLTMSVIFLLMAYMAGSGAELGDLLPMLATFALAAIRLIPVANRINDNLNAVHYHRSALDLVYRSLLENEETSGITGPAIRPERPVPKNGPLREGIVLKDVAFQFDDADAPLYEHVGLTIPAGKSVAFVGATGSGKTTLADIILGLHRPTQGRVLADGHDIHAEGDWWADRIGYIPQFIYLCNGTIRENVSFGIAPEETDDQRVWECLRQAQMKDFVRALPEGLDTLCGENGVRFSGGQRQRIGIARALYTDPPFLVFDEATSSLDSETEEAVMESINALQKDKTLLMIAHRLSTIRSCDFVYRVEGGTVTLERIGPEKKPD